MSKNITQLDNYGILPLKTTCEEVAELAGNGCLDDALALLKGDKDRKLKIIQTVLKGRGFTIHNARFAQSETQYIQHALEYFKERFHTDMSWVPVIEADIEEVNGLSTDFISPSAAMPFESHIVVVHPSIRSVSTLCHEWIHTVRTIMRVCEKKPEDYKYEEKICSYTSRRTAIFEGIEFPSLIWEFSYIRRRLSETFGPMMNYAFIRLPNEFLHQIFTERMDASVIHNIVQEKARAREGAWRALHQKVSGSSEEQKDKTRQR